MISLSSDADLQTSLGVTVVGVAGDIEPALVQRIRETASNLHNAATRANLRVAVGIHFRVDSDKFSALVPVFLVGDNSMDKLGPLVDVGDNTALTSRIPFDEPTFIELDKKLNQVADQVSDGKLGPMYFVVETNI